MGAGASAGISAEPVTPKCVVLKKFPDAIEEELFVNEKFSLVLDPTEQGSRFLKYQVGSFILMEDPTMFTIDNIKKSFISALKYGRTFTIKTKSLSALVEFFASNDIPAGLMQRDLLFSQELWKPFLDPLDPESEEYMPSQDFVFVICTVDEEPIPPQLSAAMGVLKVVDNVQTEESGENPENDAMMQVAALYGAKEIVRNSVQLVEAAFDGDMDTILEWRDKGYSIESVDARKHTAISEAAAQGHLDIVKFLIDEGANPNALSDTGRSALWRASFAGHFHVVEYLLNSGADPTFRDKVSMESAYDVAKTEEVRELLANWDFNITEKLKEERRKLMIMKIEENIKTSAERELFARAKLRQELIEKTQKGDVNGVKELLLMLAMEADRTASKPRAHAEIRNELGQSLLSIATQRDDVDMAFMLLNHWKTCDMDEFSSFDNTRVDPDTGMPVNELSTEAQVFKTNPNSRDLKGWNCVAVAVFHHSLKVLKLLLQNGGNPSIRSSYGKNALDLAKDELDAARNVVVDKSDIREVFLEWEKENNNSKAIFGNNSISAVLRNDVEYDDEGNVIERNIENMTDFIDEDKPGGKKSKNPKKKIGKATCGVNKCSTTANKSANKSGTSNTKGKNSKSK